MMGLCTSSLLCLRGKGSYVFQLIVRKREVILYTRSAARGGYCSVCGESFPSDNKGIFKAQLFFWSGDLREGNVASRIVDTVLKI